MYTVYDYGRMIADEERMDAFTQAMRQAIIPESVVLDIGTGTGILALLACQFGAKRVYAIEPNDAIQVAREMSSANGYAERIKFIQDVSTKVTLPERADVIVSDIGGALPLYEHHIPSMIDARSRLLAPDGVLIPQCDSLWAAIVEAPKLYAECTTPWGNSTYGLDMEIVKDFLTNRFSRGEVKPGQLLVEPQPWATLDYSTVMSPDVRSELTWTTQRSGTGYGFVVWIDRTFREGVSLSNSPLVPESSRPANLYRSVFFPWFTPISLAAGDTVSVMIRADLTGDSYTWHWSTQVAKKCDPSRVKVSFSQSTFLSVPLAAAQLHKRAADYIPALEQKGQVGRFVLT